MSETVIRINQRILERTVFLVVIVVLSILLFMSDKEQIACPAVDEQEVCRAWIAQVAAVPHTTENVTQVQNATELDDVVNVTVPVVTNVTNSTNTTSRTMIISWDVDSDDGSLTSVIVFFNSTFTTQQTLSYAMYWDDYYDDIIREEGTVRVAPEEFKRVIIFDEDSRFLHDAPEDNNVLILEVRDSEEHLVKRLEQRVRLT